MAKKISNVQAAKTPAAAKSDLSRPVVKAEIRNSPIPKASPSAAPKKEITYEMIAERAYYISQSGDASSPDENWLRAERELRGTSFSRPVHGALRYNTSMAHPDGKPRTMTVPLFPLPNVVLFPRAVLPLHVFEQRYREMTSDALKGDRMIAMALLRPGWEQNYYSRPAIEPVVCVGQIFTHEKLADGKYNFLLQGAHRARVRDEVGDYMYRMAEVELLQDDPIMEIDLSNERFRLTNMFSEMPLGAMPLAQQMLKLLSGPLATHEIADVMAFSLLEDVPLKQSLLEQTDCRARVAKVIAALEEMRPQLSAKSGRFSRESNMN